MSALEEMKIEINIGDVSLEEDGFSAVTDAFENPFEEETGSREELPVQNAGMENEKTVETADKNNSQETGEPAETRAEASGTEKDSEDKKRAEHEAAEARRKEEWEARQQAKKEAEQAQIARLSVLSDEEAAAEAVRRVGSDTERLTRRNMKECVSEYIQTLCLEDPAFARLAMHPRKTIIHCFSYINRKAREFVEQEMKDHGRKPENGVYGSDVPDDLCYQWAAEYFRDPDAEEDREKEEKFVPRAYSGTFGSRVKNPRTSAKKAGRKTDGKKNEKKPREKAADNEQFEQLTLAGLAGQEGKG